MAATPPSQPTPSGDEPKAQPLPLTFQDNLELFWQKNRTIVIGLCVFILVAIIGKGAWEWAQEQKEQKIAAAYASAITPEQLRAFISANQGHKLAGIAELRIGDTAYGAGKYADAVTSYDKALSTLKKGPLAGRAQLGRAMAKIHSGKAPEGQAELKQLVGDEAQLKAVRTEAAYQLASLAADGGNTADVQKYIEELNRIEPASLWARRAMMLQTSLGKAPAPAAPAENKAGPNVQIKLPGK